MTILESWPDYLGWCCLLYAALLILSTYLKGKRPQHAERWMKFIAKSAAKRKKLNGWVKANELPIVWISSGLVVSALIVFGVIYGNTVTTYDQYFGIVRVEGNHAYRFIDLATGELREIRFCSDYDESKGLFAGYVLKKLVVVETGTCEWLNRADLHYDVVRGDDAKWWKSPYSSVTKPDGDSRPILAKNCFNTPDDKSTSCIGGDAKFTVEEANAKPAR